MAILKSLIVNGVARVIGDLTASKIIKQGGVSSLFLKADGSVDSNAYIVLTSSARPGVTKLYRRDVNDGYNVLTLWDGTYWILLGYYEDTYHAPCRVSYADNADTARDATLHNGYTIVQTNGLTSTIRNFTLGTLVRTSIDYSVTRGDPFYVEIKGNTYGNALNSCFTQIQGYIYDDTIIAYGVTHLGVLKITPITAMNLNGKLCFWFPRLGYWMGFDIRCYRGTNYAINTVTSIEDSADPGGTKRVTLTTQEITSYHSGNLTASVIGNLGTLSNNISGNAATATSALDTDKLDGYHATYGNNKPWGTIPVITTTGWMDVGKHFEFHYDNTTGSDYSTYLGCTGNYGNVVYLPSASGTLALTSQIPTSLPANGGNADTVDNEHSSAFAHVGAHNNLTASGNEFTFASSGFNGYIWFNYRTAGGANGNITEYKFGNGKGGELGTAIHSGNYNSYAPKLDGTGATGTWGINITGNADTVDGYHASDFATAGHTHSYLPLSGGTLTGQFICDYNLANQSFYTWKNSRQRDGEQGRADDFILLQKADGSFNAHFGTFGESATDNYIFIGYDSYYGRNLRIGPSSLTWGDDTILHAGNYNNYAPKLDGTGAYGTWGINISGNAATAGSVAWDNISGKPTNHVTTDTAQTITGEKTFATNILTISNPNGGDATLKFYRGGNTAWSIVDTVGNLKFNDLNSNTTRLTLLESSQGGYAQFAGNINSTGFVKDGSSDNYVLLGGGGHKKESELSVGNAASAGNADTVDNLHESSFYVQGRGTINAQVDLQTIPKDISGGWAVTNPGWGGMVAVLGQGHYMSNRGIGFLFKGGQTSRINLLTQVDNTWYNNGVIAYTSDIPTSLPANGGNADTVDNQHFSYSNDSNSPTYLWATNSNGTSFLAARTSLSVNYASSAGAVTVTTSNSASTYNILFNNGNVICSNTTLTVTPSSGNVTSSGHFYANSDIRYKNIIEHHYSLSDKIAQLPIIKYKWTDRDDDSIRIGSSALSVMNIIPELVSYDDNTDFYSLDYATLGAVAGISACKEVEILKLKIKELELEIIILKSKYNG